MMIHLYYPHRLVGIVHGIQDTPTLHVTTVANILHERRGHMVLSINNKYIISVKKALIAQKM